MIWIGIDPGKNGGYALICDNEPDVHPWDDDAFVTWMVGVRAVAKANNQRVVAAVEKVGAMPGQGVSSTFSFGQSYGFILGVLSALEIPYQTVPPRKWKAEFGLNSDKSKSIEVCKRLFPDVDLLPTRRCRKDSDGMAESLLLAEFARREM